MGDRFYSADWYELNPVKVEENIYTLGNRIDDQAVLLMEADARLEQRVTAVERRITRIERALQQRRPPPPSEAARSMFAGGRSKRTKKNGLVCFCIGCRCSQGSTNGF